MIESRVIQNDFEIDYDAPAWWLRWIVRDLGPDATVDSIRWHGSDVMVARTTCRWWRGQQTRWVRMKRRSGYVSVGTEEPIE